MQKSNKNEPKQAHKKDLQFKKIKKAKTMKKVQQNTPLEVKTQAKKSTKKLIEDANERI